MLPNAWMNEWTERTNKEWMYRKQKHITEEGLKDGRNADEKERKKNIKKNYLHFIHFILFFKDISFFSFHFLLILFLLTNKHKKWKYGKISIS